MKRRLVVGACAVAMLAMSGMVIAQSLESGPQTGKRIPGPFHPLNVTGKQAGKKHCLV
jgi:hypothetical protein